MSWKINVTEPRSIVLLHGSQISGMNLTYSLLEANITWIGYIWILEICKHAGRVMGIETLEGSVQPNLEHMHIVVAEMVRRQCAGASVYFPAHAGLIPIRFSTAYMQTHTYNISLLTHGVNVSSFSGIYDRSFSLSLLSSTSLPSCFSSW